MHETPRARRAHYPRTRLDGYRWHTGATLRPLDPDEPCPILFRDVGLDATLRFLRGGLSRLAGPLTPLTYLRTWRYREPYEDHEATGRLVVLRPLALEVWHSGVEHVYVADARRNDREAMVAWVPGDLSLEAAEGRLAGARTLAEAREALGGRAYAERAEADACRLAEVAAQLAEVEALAAPLRGMLQSRDARARDAAVATLARLGLTEHDLCAAWHHLPRGRRAHLAAALRAEARR